MGLGSNTPERLSAQRHVYLGKDSDGIRVGNRVSLPYGKNTYIKDLMTVASEPLGDNLPQPRRESGTLYVYGRSANNDDSYIFSMSIKTIDGVAFGSIIKSQNGIQTVHTGIILQREQGVPTNFKYFTPSNKNELCILDPNSGTLTNVDLGMIIKLTVECGEIPFESDTHKITERAKSVEITDDNGLQVKTLPNDDIAKIFAAQELGRIIPTVESEITPIAGSPNGDYAIGW
jgi:hypothetical protein